MRISGDMMKKRSTFLLEKLKTLAKSTRITVCRVGQEDPCRVIHSLKVGFSLTLVSLLYLLEPFFNGIGQNAIWAVMTVVVVLEFTAGATLCKGLNRGIGTLLAGSLAFFIEFIAQESGRVFRAIFIGTAVFLVGISKARRKLAWRHDDTLLISHASMNATPPDSGTGATYMRFFPYIKKNYEYGVVIFLLTFNLITVSSYRIHNVLKIAQDRFFMIAIGCGICLFMSLIVLPNWSGQHLHISTVSKLEGLATSIEACVTEYFSNENPNVVKDKSSEDPIYKGYKAVLDSKSTDETLATHASWEPCHSRNCERFPWQQYVKLGDILRHFGYTLVALHGCLQTEIQTPRSVRALFRDPCIQVAGEVSKALMELADSIRNHRQCSPEILSDHLHEALHDLDTALKSQPRLFLGANANATNNMLALAAATANGQRSSKRDSGVSLTSFKTDSSALLQWKSKRQASEMSERKSLRPTLSKIAITSLEFSEALPFAAFASLLVEAVARLDLVIDEVEELGRVANFREFCAGDDRVAANRHKGEGGSAPMENHLPSHGVE